MDAEAQCEEWFWRQHTHPPLWWTPAELAAWGCFAPEKPTYRTELAPAGIRLMLLEARHLPLCDDCIYGRWCPVMDALDRCADYLKAKAKAAKDYEALLTFCKGIRPQPKVRLHVRDWGGPGGRSDIALRIVRPKKSKPGRRRARPKPTVPTSPQIAA